MLCTANQGMLQFHRVLGLQCQLRTVFPRPKIIGVFTAKYQKCDFRNEQKKLKATLKKYIHKQREHKKYLLKA